MKSDPDLMPVMILGMLGVVLGAFAYFSSGEAHDRGEGFRIETPRQLQPTYCKPQFKGDTYCKLNR